MVKHSHQNCLCPRVATMLVSVRHFSLVSTKVITGVAHTLVSPIRQRNLENNKYS